MDLLQVITPEQEEPSQALIAGVGDQMIAIPLKSVLTIEKIAASEINSVNFDTYNFMIIKKHFLLIFLVFLKFQYH